MPRRVRSILRRRDKHVRLGMHGIGLDNHWVITYPNGSANLTASGMSNGLDALSPAALFSTAPDATGGEVKVLPHLARAANGHIVSISPVAIGTSIGKCGS